LGERRLSHQRKVAAGSATFPPPDRSGESTSLGPFPVSLRFVARSTVRLSPLAPLLPPVPAQGLRMLVSAALAPGSLLRPDLSRCRTTLATLAGQSNLQGHCRRQGAATGPEQTLSRPCPAAIISHGAGTPKPSRRARLSSNRGGDTPNDRSAARNPRGRQGSAPCGNSRKILRPALP